MTQQDRFATWTLKDFEDYNRRYDAGEFAGSEARKFNLTVINYFIKIRDSFKYTDDTSGDNWEALDIKTSHSKYGVNYIYIDRARKLWRTRDTAGEFYCGPAKKLYII